MKKLAIDDLIALRDTLRVPFTDAQLEADPYLPPYYNPGPDSLEVQYMLDRRRTSAGSSRRAVAGHDRCTLDTAPAIKAVDKGSGRQQVATTMALVRIFRKLLRDPEIGSPDRADHPRRGARSAWTRGSRR